MHNLGVTPSEYIEICLGLFCYHNFLFDKSQIKRFEKDFDVKFENITKINIKEDLILKIDPEGRVVHIPFDKIVDYVRPACFSCTDFTNSYSDISFGGLGSPDKYTTVIPRTEKGKKLFHKVLGEKIIKNLVLKAPEKENMKELITKFSHSKMEREASFMKNL